MPCIFRIYAFCTCFIWTFLRIVPLGSKRRWGWFHFLACVYVSITGSVALTMWLSFFFLRYVVGMKYRSIICTLEFKLVLQIVISNMKSNPAFSLKMRRWKSLCPGTPAEGRPQLGWYYFTYLHLNYMTLKMFPLIV